MDNKEFSRLKRYLLSVSDSPDLVSSVMDDLRPWFDAAAGRSPVLQPIGTRDPGEAAYAIAAVIMLEVDCLRQISARSPIIRSLADVRPMSIELDREGGLLRHVLGPVRWADLQAQVWAHLGSDLENRLCDECRNSLGEQVFDLARGSLRAIINCAAGWAVSGKVERTQRFLLLLKATRGEIVLGEMPERPGWWVLLAA